MTSSIIDYEKLVLDYQESLATVLRGFRPATEFLESWVHDENDLLSLLNIVESAEQAGEKEILIYIGAKTLSKLELKNLVALVEKIGKIETESYNNGLNFKVSFKKNDSK